MSEWLICIEILIELDQFFEDVVWSEGFRSVDVRCDRGATDDRGVDRVLHPGATRDEGRSTRSAALRIETHPQITQG